jgi:hypothetical protein
MKDNLGIGVMINMLCSNEETVNAVKASAGKTIAALSLEEGNVLKFVFSDGSKLDVWDDGQSCCEHRYMATGDRLSDYVGAVLEGFEIKSAPCEEDQYGEHEVQFMDVRTSKGVFQMANHNEHNGYYGGFYMKAAFSEGQ